MDLNFNIDSVKHEDGDVHQNAFVRRLRGFVKDEKTREKFKLQMDSDLWGGDNGFGRSQTPIEHEKIGQKHSKGGRG